LRVAAVAESELSHGRRGLLLNVFAQDGASDPLAAFGGVSPFSRGRMR
jgi:hypothetical protein